ncbi:unnamed protein product [Rotaria sp. Silwood2]|nr:unnamed protein product [Rotaria sp. Silwood2]
MRVFIRPPWSEPIPRDLKETRLQQFLQRMSMSELAETTYAVCNIRTPAKDSKKLSISKIPNIHLLKVSEELNDLIINIQSPSLQHSRSHREISANNNNIKITGYAKTRPPDRIHLKKILTVRKKKIIRALHWLKNYNVLYQNVKINLENIAQLPEDDVPECNMSKLEQKLGDEELQSERVGYVPDPLFNPTEHTTADTIPINNSGVLDVNGASVSSEEIANYFLQKIKNNGNKGQMDIENVCLYPTLSCYGCGAPEDQSRPVQIKLKEHIRYLLSYDDRHFETNHSFILVIFNLLQRRDARFHTQLIATKPYFQSSADEILPLSSKDIETALDDNSKRIYNSESSNRLNKLLQHIKTIGGRVMGSAYSRTA